jgi:sodium/hydrogen exchanger 8
MNILLKDWNGTIPDDSHSQYIKDATANLVLLGMLMFSILITYILSSRGWNKYLPESGASMIWGIIIGLIFRFSNLNMESQFFFHPEIFYFFLLPPIIFEAGYNMNKKNFFVNMGSILMFAIVGTFVSAFVFGYGLYGLVKLGIISNFEAKHPLECLLFGSLISATDPVATLSIMGSPGMNVHPLVYSLIFGESVLNDAVSIVLFRTFAGFSKPSTFSFIDVLKAIGKFCAVSLGSIGIGLGIGLLSAFFIKRGTHLKQLPYLELSATFLFAYSSYVIAEMIELSGVLSLFLTGVLMKHYNWYSLSEDSQISTNHLFKTISFLTETFVFVYVGINVSSFSPELKWNPSLMIIGLLLVFISRAVNVFFLSLLLNIRRKDKITLKMQLMQWFAGLRGAVAFALSLNLPASPQKSVLITATLFIILFTTLVMGTLTAPVLKKLGLQCKEEDIQDLVVLPTIEEKHIDNMEGKERLLENENEEILEIKPKKIKKPSFLHRKWQLFDEKFMKPLFGGKLREEYRIDIE